MFYHTNFRDVYTLQHMLKRRKTILLRFVIFKSEHRIHFHISIKYKMLTNKRRKNANHISNDVRVARFINISITWNT